VSFPFGVPCPAFCRSNGTPPRILFKLLLRSTVFPLSFVAVTWAGPMCLIPRPLFPAYVPTFPLPEKVGGSAVDLASPLRQPVGLASSALKPEAPPPFHLAGRATPALSVPALRCGNSSFPSLSHGRLPFFLRVPFFPFPWNLPQR